MGNISNAGRRVDNLFKLAAEVEKENAAVLKKKRKLGKMQDELLAAMNSNNIETLGGKLGKVSIRTTEFIEVKDWERLRTFVKKTGFIDLFQARINTSNYKEILETEKFKKIPGLEKAVKRSLHRTKNRK